ncbi:hypothetical protein DYBT9623_03112 [Dyadobacter sp. CECT 9623]|uniref:PIN domain-containing protein n=1 Tax=Dyadobacter linearis TaxID=2823330 RepID=A0ABN7R8J8_9BACT|nr:type II toxin-antitoxin system VapC family toxin [Dyadobacter sp. CECT 9623]CAG5070566.1 hypothetical protein DYBT9623_03112 [Dyadobacter sp. CECT 9623]
MEQYLIDSNAVSHYLSGLLPDDGMVFLDGVINQIPIISVITQIELLSWKTASGRLVEDFVNDSQVLAITPDVVKICVKIRRERKVKTPDAIIAATAIANNLTLITDNEKDFVNIPNLKVINPKNINSNPGL